ncbi:PEBP-like protein [Hypoxylon rubiginosum]|uniref:PEBP-like protein n=1 Tax=Hypoxylon rubiginosum TaxID=110542 RepID=A0ACC0DHY5_9PEZI|nr:PEBP-like protein [Hypoxylon rubiginosum]
MTALIEVSLSWLFKNAKGRDAKSFYTRPAFADFQSQDEQEIIVTAPEIGPTNSKLDVQYTRDGAGLFPTLHWEAPQHLAGQVKEWLIVSEDPDAPLPTPICHGIYTGIPATKTSVENKDFEVEDSSKALLKGGFHYGKSMRGDVYITPRPLMNHGPHRYFFQVIALREPLDPKFLSATTTREQIADAIVGKVLGWGMWVGVAERKW